MKSSAKSLGAPFVLGLRHGKKWLTNAWSDTGKVLILAYHQIVPDITSAEAEMIPGMLVSAATFRRQMEILRECYEVLTLAEAEAALRGQRELTRPAAVVTFDDGYRSVYEHALPVLRELALPATLFIPTAYIGAGRMLAHDQFYRCYQQARTHGLSLRVPLLKAGLSFQQAAALSRESDPVRFCERLLHLPLALREDVQAHLAGFLVEERVLNGYSLLDWELLRELLAAQFTIGAHTSRHAILTLEDQAVSEQEIRSSKQMIEAQLGQPVRYFAYPNGAYNNAVKQTLARAGFTAAVTTEKRLNRRGADLLALGRISLCEQSTRGITGQYSETIARLRLAG